MGMMRTGSGSKLLLLLICLLFWLSWARARAADTPPTDGETSSVADAARLGAIRLQQWYNPQTGLWDSTGWWNSANALTALIDYSRVSGSPRYTDVIATTYAANLPMGFLNEYYDDEGWWALAWIDAYDLTHKAAYLETAQSIFEDMTGGWDETCGGGLWWRKKRDGKNAIENELFLSVAAHLANRVEDRSQRDEYRNWADREWQWFRRSGMIEGDHLIADGLDAHCQDNHGHKWSYNQGVIVGGLAELARHEHRGELREARRIADAAVTRLSDENEILHDGCEPKCGRDGTQFKGIFVRNLALLWQRKPDASYRRFILRNANSIIGNDQEPDHSFGVLWSGPPEGVNASTQSSALDALVAAMEVNPPESVNDGRTKHKAPYE